MYIVFNGSDECFMQWHMGIDDFVSADESVMGIGKVFTETSRVAIYG